MSNKSCATFSEEAAFSSRECTELRKLAESRKLRITPLREMVYLFVRHAEKKGISAYQILELMKKYNPRAKPITVYRSLDYLQQAGVITKMESCSKFIKKNNLLSEGITLFMICENCGTIIQHTDNNIRSYVEKQLAGYGCALKDKDIEIRVICPACRV